MPMQRPIGLFRKYSVIVPMSFQLVSTAGVKQFHPMLDGLNYRECGYRFGGIAGRCHGDT